MLQSTSSGATPQVDGSSTVTEHVRKKAKSTRKESPAKEPSRRGRKASRGRTISDLTPEARLAFSQRFNSADDTGTTAIRRRNKLVRSLDRAIHPLETRTRQAEGLWGIGCRARYPARQNESVHAPQGRGWTILYRAWRSRRSPPPAGCNRHEYCKKSTPPPQNTQGGSCEP